MTLDAEAELAELLDEGYALAGRVGYLARHELRARLDAAVERIDHHEFVQLVRSRDPQQVVVRIEEPGVPSPRLVVLARDAREEPRVVVRVGDLYLGGAFRVAERIDEPAQAEARWLATSLRPCWVEDAEPGCC